jgi:hypothetical protein
MSVERIQLRRGTTSAWSAANPILYLGEFGVEKTVSDQVLLKIGDGETSWNSLPYITAEIDLSAYYTSSQTDQKIASDIGAASAVILGQLAGKSDVSHNHALSSLTDVEVDGVTLGQYLKFDGTEWVPGTVSTPTTFDYNDLVNVPTSFEPSEHTHAISEVVNLQTTLDGKASSAHSHSISDITNLQSSLDGKASSSHTHQISDTTGLQSALDSKASSSHTHTLSNISDIANLAVSSSQVTTSISDVSSNYSTQASDNGKLINSTASSAVTITISNSMSAGQSLAIFQSGAGIVTIAPGSGVTLQGAGVSGTSLAINDRYSSATVFCLSSGTYAVIGNVSGV